MLVRVHKVFIHKLLTLSFFKGGGRARIRGLQSHQRHAGHRRTCTTATGLLRRAVYPPVVLQQCQVCPCVVGDRPA